MQLNIFRPDTYLVEYNVNIHANNRDNYNFINAHILNDNLINTNMQQQNVHIIIFYCETSIFI